MSIGAVRRHGQRRHEPRRHGQRGVGLIEILVAVVLLSIGFLGAARMQMYSMRHSQNAYFGSQAYLLAAEMADRMRANLEGVAAGHYDNLTTSDSAVDPGCDAKFCTTQEIARQDLFDWSARLHAIDGVPGFVPALPGSDTEAAVGQVNRLASGQFAVTLRWQERVTDEDIADGAGGNACGDATSLNGCLTISVALENVNA